MEEIRAKTLKGVQEQNCRSHCSFRPLHLLSPFPFIQAHSFQSRINSSLSWPTSHLHFRGPNWSPMQQPIFLFFFFSFPTYPSLPPFFSHATNPPYSHPTSYNQPPLPSLSPFFSHANSHHPTCPSLSPFSSPYFLHEQPPKHPPHLLTMLAAPWRLLLWL